MSDVGYTAVPDIDSAGATVWWKLSAGGIWQTHLSAALDEAGVPEEQKRLPELPAPETALKRALSEHTTTTRLRRPLKKGFGFELVDERRGEHRNEYDQVMSVSVDKVGRLHFNPNTYSQASMVEEIEKTYKAELDLLSHHDISTWLVQQVEMRNSVRLRESGGIYFIPRNQVDGWRRLIKALRAASQHVGYMMPTLRTSEALEAISDAILDEAKRQRAKIEGEMADKKYGPRALRNRIDRCEAVMDKVKQYEALIGSKLDTARAEMDELTFNIGAALLQAEAEEDEEAA